MEDVLYFIYHMLICALAVRNPALLKRILSPVDLITLLIINSTYGGAREKPDCSQIVISSLTLPSNVAKPAKQAMTQSKKKKKRKP